jgi:transposase
VGRHPPPGRERAVRLYRESSPRPSFKQLGEQLYIHPEALRGWVRQAEVGELRRVNEVLKAASGYFASEIGPTRRWS